MLFLVRECLGVVVFYLTKVEIMNSDDKKLDKKLHIGNHTVASLRMSSILIFSMCQMGN